MQAGTLRFYFMTPQLEAPDVGTDALVREALGGATLSIVEICAQVIKKHPFYSDRVRQLRSDVRKLLMSQQDEAFNRVTNSEDAVPYCT